MNFKKRWDIFEEGDGMDLKIRMGRIFEEKDGTDLKRRMGQI